MEETLNSGFDPELEEKGIQEDNNHYFLGGKGKLGDSKVPLVILRENGDYRDLVVVEKPLKKNGVETMNCTSFGNHAGERIFIKAKYGEDVNDSERFSGIGAGTTERGNSVHRVCEWQRLNGFIPESWLAFTDKISP